VTDYCDKLDLQHTDDRLSGVTREVRGGGAPGDTRRNKKSWANLQRIVEKLGRTGKKKVWGDTLEGGDTRVKAITSDSDSDSDEQKRSPGFQKKIKG